MYLDNKAIWYVTTLSVKLQEKFSNLFSFMLRDRFSPISSLFFKNEVYLTYYMMYDSDASIKSPGILYYSILFTVFQLFTNKKRSGCTQAASLPFHAFYRSSLKYASPRLAGG